MRASEILDPVIDESLTQTLKRAAIPVAASAAMLYGGVKATDYLTQSPHEVMSTSTPQFGPGDWVYGDSGEDTNANTPVAAPEQAADGPVGQPAPQQLKSAPKPSTASGKPPVHYIHDAASAAYRSAVKATGLKDRRTLILALTIWGEARSQGELGMRAVGHVIKNRANQVGTRWADRDIVGVALQHKQFSCWNPSDPNLFRMMNINHLKPNSLDEERWQQAVEIASKIVHGERDPTAGATFYHTTAVNPFWGAAKHFVAKLGSHVFYREPKKGEPVAAHQPQWARAMNSRG